MSKVAIPRPKRIKGKALRAGGCRWPAWGDKDAPNHLYCAEAAAPGKVYCGLHWKIAHSAGVKTP